MRRIGLWSDDCGLCPRQRKAMRKTLPTILEGYRIWDGNYGSEPGSLHGVFNVKQPDGSSLVIMSSGVDSKYGWEHVSVSLEHRAPTWEEMCVVKNLFWEDDEWVVQFHPDKAFYVNYHPHCLHLWRPMRQRLPTPPTILVGPRQGT
jgi:hypothetical protein